MTNIGNELIIAYLYIGCVFGSLFTLLAMEFAEYIRKRKENKLKGGQND